MNKFVDLSRPVIHHLHLDKSNLITKDLLHLSQRHMCKKWFLMRKLKQSEEYSEKNIRKRILKTTEELINNGCRHFRTHIDIDHLVGLKCINVALEIKEQYKKKNIHMQVGTQTLEGLDNEIDYELFLEAANLEGIDFLGCLPSRDKNPSIHLDKIFNTASSLGYDGIPVEVHADQLSVPLPQEKESELVCSKTEDFNYQGKVRIIHAISLARFDKEYQRRIAKRMARNRIFLVICPSAALGMQLDDTKLYNIPIHNSIAPLKILLEEGVNVGLGCDNILDLFCPYTEASPIHELKLLSESTRIYDPDILHKIFTNKEGFV